MLFAPGDDLALLPVAHLLADAARVETLRHFRTSGLQIDSKGDAFDPVTEADRAAEAAMRAILARERPDDGILGEEMGVHPGSSGIDWILDPIDGTRGFMSGAPTWGVLIAAARGGIPFLGIIDQPHIGERFVGAAGTAFVDGRAGRVPLRTRGRRPLEQAVLYSTFPEIGTDEERRAFRRVSDRVRLTRYGCDCYAYALVAMGQIDLVIEAGLQPYDIAAPIAVIEAAGGIVTDWTGGPAHGGGRVIAAANAGAHADALALLAEG